jgi:hypothetical protein
VSDYLERFRKRIQVDELGRLYYNGKMTKYTVDDPKAAKARAMQNIEKLLKPTDVARADIGGGMIYGPVEVGCPVRIDAYGRIVACTLLDTECTFIGMVMSQVSAGYYEVRIGNVDYELRDSRTIPFRTPG